MRRLILILVSLVAMFFVTNYVKYSDASIDLSDLNISGNKIEPGKTQLFEKAISKKDIVNLLGNPNYDKIYDYAQGFRVMKYQDKEHKLILEVIYFKTSDTSIVNWVELKEMN